MDERELPGLKMNAASAACMLRCDEGRVISAKFGVTSGPQLYGSFFDELRGTCMFEPCSSPFSGRAWKVSGHAGETVVAIEHDDGLEVLYCRSALHELASLLPLVVGAWRRVVHRTLGPGRPLQAESRWLADGVKPVSQIVPIEQLLRNAYSEAVEAKGSDLLGARIGRIEQLTQTLMDRIHALEAALAAANAAAAAAAEAKPAPAKVKPKAAKAKKIAKKAAPRAAATPPGPAKAETPAAQSTKAAAAPSATKKGPARAKSGKSTSPARSAKSVARTPTRKSRRARK